jgi:hypothetical protein
MSRLKSFGVVTLVTILIWLWAEASIVSDPARAGNQELLLENVPVLIACTPATAKAFDLQPQTPLLGPIRVRGTREALDAIRNAHASPRIIVEINNAAPGLLVVPGEISPSWLGLTVVGPPIKVVIQVTGR